MLVTFQDQNFNSIQARDSNVLIALLVRQGVKKQQVITQQAIIPLLKSITFKDDENLNNT